MIFDIGSNIGDWSKANIATCDKIIAIEASPITFQTLVNRCQHDKIVLLNYAVCNNGGNDITFYHADCAVLSTVNKDWLTKDTSRFCNQPYTEMICKTITIDALIEQYGIPDLIKIDVEGGEFFTISSLTQKVKLLCFEWACELNDVTFNCLDYLVHLGFSQFYIQNGDNYSFRPQESEFGDVDAIKMKLSGLMPKHDWGMIWCK